MSLLDRLSGVDGDNRIPSHQFFGSMVLMANGSITEDTLKAQWGIVDGVTLNEWNALRNSFQSATNKDRWLETVHGVFLCAEDELFDMRTKSTAISAIQAAE